MDSQNRRKGAVVDDILQEMKGKDRPAAKRDDARLDSILAELGVSSAKKPAAGTKTAAPAPAPAKAPAGQPAPAQRQAAPAQAAAQQSGQTQAKRAATSQRQGSDHRPGSSHRPEQPEVFAPVAPPKREEDDSTLVMERPSQRMNRINRGRVSKGHTATILDIQPTSQTMSIPRVGKAAAMDKVESGKFEDDQELLSWFDPDASISKRDRKRMEKERKKQEAADRKAAKRAEKSGDYENNYETAETEAGLPDVSGLFGGETPAPSAPRPTAEPVASSAAPARVQPAKPTARPQQPPPQQRPTQPQAPRAAKPAEEGWVVLDSSTGLDEVVIDVPAKNRQASAAPTQQPAAQRPAQAPARAPQPVPAAPVKAAATAGAAAAGAAAAATAPPKTGGPKPAPETRSARAPSTSRVSDTQTFEPEEEPKEEKIPTAAYTQEFETDGHMAATQELEEKEGKSLFLDEMVDDQFRAFFGETIIMDKTDKEELGNTAATGKVRRRGKKSRTSLFTGEFAQLALDAEAEEELAAAAGDEPEIEEYSRPQDADKVQADLEKLKKSLTTRTVATGIIGVLLLWMGLSYAGFIPFPVITAEAYPVIFSLVYLALIVAAIAINFTTVAAGLVGLVGEPTVDSAPALASLFGLLQGVVLFTQLLNERVPAVTLFGGLAALILAANALGKRIRARVILDNFHLTSGGFDHSAAYILDSTQHELASTITSGLEEPEPVMLLSRPTAFVKGFMRQSFSVRQSDYTGRILGWILCGAGLAAAVVSYLLGKDLVAAVSSAAAVLCIGAPFTSTLLSAIPSAIMQQNNSKVGAVVPGWSAIEDLGEVNVVMAGARDIFPPSSVTLKGIKTYEKERIDLAILYAASVLIEGCDTLRDIFNGVIQGKSDMLYKVESLTTEPGRGFTAWVENQRIVIGSREMLQRHAIEPPSIESELQYTKEGCLPVYLAVSGKLFAMFVVRYAPDPEVADTLESLVNSGLSLLVTSDDMNIDADLIERAYALPPGVVKVLGEKELRILEPMTSYQPESAGVMSHIGTFTSFIGGMRAAAGCALSEKWSGYVQLASVILAVLLCLGLAVSGGLAALSMGIILLYQLGWTLFVSIPMLLRF